jgi:hypothetical protein
MSDTTAAIPTTWERRSQTRTIRMKSPPAVEGGKTVEHNIYCIVDLEQGQPCALRIIVGDEGSTERGLLRVVGILASRLLSRGEPIQEIARLFRGQQFEPDGAVNFNGRFERVGSVLDAVGVYLEGKYTEVAV